MYILKYALFSQLLRVLIADSARTQLDLPEPAWTTLETSLLLSMCSFDAVVRTRSRECFETIARLSPETWRDASNRDNLILLAISTIAQSTNRQSSRRSLA